METNKTLREIINEVNAGMTATADLAVQCIERLLKLIEVDGDSVDEAIKDDQFLVLVREIVLSAALINRDGIEEFCFQLITFPLREYMPAEKYEVAKEGVRTSLREYITNDLSPETIMLYDIMCRTDKY